MRGLLVGVSQTPCVLALYMVPLPFPFQDPHRFDPMLLDRPPATWLAYAYAPVFSRPVSPSCVCDDVPLLDLDPLPVPLAAPAPPLEVAAAAVLFPEAAEAVAAVVTDAAKGTGEGLEGPTGSIMACGAVRTSCGCTGWGLKGVRIVDLAYISNRQQNLGRGRGFIIM